jgi:hypothetical protein
MKNQKEQTTVEWIEQEMLKGDLSMKQILEQGKEMEKERAIKFACDVHMNVKKDKVKSLMQLVDEKYNETYGGNK